MRNVPLIKCLPYVFLWTIMIGYYDIYVKIPKKSGGTYELFIPGWQDSWFKEILVFSITAAIFVALIKYLL